MENFEKSEVDEIESTERREVLASLMKYSAVVGGASTVVLSASEAVAKSSASGRGKPCDNNGRFGGDGTGCGNSEGNENSGQDQDGKLP